MQGVGHRSLAREITRQWPVGLSGGIIQGIRQVVQGGELKAFPVRRDKLPGVAWCRHQGKGCSTSDLGQPLCKGSAFIEKMLGRVDMLACGPRRIACFPRKP